MNKFISDIFSGWSAEANYGFSPLGKIWIIWHPSLLVTIIYKSLHMITFEVIWPSNQSGIVISPIYPSNNVTERAKFWTEITSLVSSNGLDSKPWLFLGDFNQISDLMEHSNPSSLNMDTRNKDFSDYLLNANVENLNFRGTIFTRWNKCKRAPIAKKLDRSLVNDEWYRIFPSSVTHFGSPEFSDQAAISITLEHGRVRVKKPFRFYNFHTQSPDFLDMICSSWYSFNIPSYTMFILKET